jgi:hypothetical protein
MNKFEKLIEYIINDEDQKARELFHDIVVEKSRDIYESIMDEEQMGEEVHGMEVEDLTKEVAGEESAMEGEEEFGDDEGEEEFGDEEPEMGQEEAEHEEIEDQVMNIDAKLDELLAKFDEIMGGEEPAGEEHGEEDFGQEEPEMGQEEEEPAMFEGENPFASGKSGKSGSGSAASGKSGSAVSGKSGSAKSGTSGKKGSAELMREYVDTVGQIYGGQGDATEGDPVGGEGKKVAVNKKPGSVGPGADLGGTPVKATGPDSNQDGKTPTKASNEYTKGEGKLIGNVGNTPGGDKKLKSEPAGHGAEKNGDSETGENAGAKDTMGKNINKKSEIGGQVR